MALSCRCHLPASVGLSGELKVDSERKSRSLIRVSWKQDFVSSFAGKRVSGTVPAAPRRKSDTMRRVSANLFDFVGGDLIGLDLDQWADDVENFGSIGFYAPLEGGAEGRYATVLKTRGYHLMNISARGLGDPEAYLLKTHGVRPPHLGKQAVARFYYPPEVDLRLSALPPHYKGLVLWIGEAEVLAKNELQFLAVLPVLRPNVKVVCEMGGSRKFYWKTMKDLVGLPASTPQTTVASTPLPSSVEKETIQA